MDIKKIQSAIQSIDADGWLLYDFQGRDRLAFAIVGMDPGKFMSRRWFYYIPSRGEPVKLVSKVEKTVLDALPGKHELYLSWKELHSQLRKILGNTQRVAMNYSPMSNIPYASIVDAGTIELIRSLGYEPVSAADLIQLIEAVIDERGYRSHLDAGDMVLAIKDEAYGKIHNALESGSRLTEYEVQRFIMARFEESGLTCEDHGPIVGVNEHPADPHFEPTPENSHAFKRGDTILIDLWAKKKEPGSIYYDVTWCGFAGETPPPKYVEIFHTVRDARDAAVQFVRSKFAAGDPCYGWEVDDACRQVVKDAGYGEYFLHRTGHSIGTSVHGNGVHIDNLETKDLRQLIPGICFSIEPGIYLEGEMAARSEINVFITLEGEVVVHGDAQRELILV